MRQWRHSQCTRRHMMNGKVFDASERAVIAVALILALHGVGIRPALAQRMSQGTTSHVIKGGTSVEAEPTRPLCEDDVAVGDTITASLHPARARLSRPRWWPKQLLATLRRAAPVTARDSALVRFVLVRATSDGAAARDARGSFWVEVESEHGKAGKESVRCFTRLNGSLSRT